MASELSQLLHSVVFGIPTPLPPSRSHDYDHSIPLLKGTTPVKVKPYRYLHS